MYHGIPYRFSRPACKYKREEDGQINNCVCSDEDLDSPESKVSLMNAEYALDLHEDGEFGEEHGRGVEYLHDVDVLRSVS